MNQSSHCTHVLSASYVTFHLVCRHIESYPINDTRATSLSYCGATTSFRKLGYAAVYNYSMKIFKYHDGIFWTNRPHITNRPHMRAICKNFRERGGEQKNFLKSGFFTLRWFPPLSLKFSQTPTSDTNAGRVPSPDRHWSLTPQCRPGLIGKQTLTHSRGHDWDMTVVIILIFQTEPLK